MHKTPVLFLFFFLLTNVALQTTCNTALALEVRLKSSSKAVCLDGGTPPPDIDFPLFCYLAIQKPKGNGTAAVYLGYLTVFQDYSVTYTPYGKKSAKIDNEISKYNRQNRVKNEEEPERYTYCEYYGDCFYGRSGCYSAPPKTWNSFLLFLQNIANYRPLNIESYITLCHGAASPDAGYVPRYTKKSVSNGRNGHTTAIVISNPLPGMKTLTRRDLQNLLTPQEKASHKEQE